MMTCPNLVLNGKDPGETEIKTLIDALSNPDVLESGGGFLFKSCLIQETLHLGITPAISGHNRLHHYDIVIPEGEAILGSVSPQGDFMLLFRSEKSRLNHQSRARWHKHFVYFAQALLCRGYSGQGKLDWITRQIIEESQIFENVPETLRDMVEFSKIRFS